MNWSSNQLMWLLALASLVSTSGYAAMSCESLVATGHPSYPPVSEAQGNTLIGRAPDLVSAVALDMGIELSIKNYGDWELAQTATERGEADIIFGIYKNNERMTWLDYMEPAFMMDPVSIAVRQGQEFAFSDWDDLKGHKGVTNAGESYGNQFDAFIANELNVTHLHGVDKAFDFLIDGSADYLIIGLYPGQREATLLGLDNEVEFLPHQVASFGMYVGFSKASKCGHLKAHFSEVLGELIDGKNSVNAVSD